MRECKPWISSGKQINIFVLRAKSNVAKNVKHLTSFDKDSPLSILSSELTMKYHQNAALPRLAFKILPKCCLASLGFQIAFPTTSCPATQSRLQPVAHSLFLPRQTVSQDDFSQDTVSQDTVSQDTVSQDTVSQDTVSQEGKEVEALSVSSLLTTPR